jgi:predicted N-acetyltransferase YhbS
MKDLEVRPCGPGETQSWTEFLNKSFGYETGQSYAVDFAPLFEPGALSRSRLAWSGGEIVSSATFFPVIAVTPRARLRLAIVGAVATHEQHRGQGLSAQVLEEIERAARGYSVDALILWSDKREHYAKLGFEPAGKQRLYMLNGLPAPAKPADGTPAYGWDWGAVRFLYETHRCRIDRSDDYWRSLEAIRSCTRVQWLDPEGRVRAYLGFDRGRDMKNVVHEWGGEPEALHTLLWTVLQNRNELLWLTHPSLTDPIRPLLGDPLVEEALALFKPVGPGATPGRLADVWFWGLDSL